RQSPRARPPARPERIRRGPRSPGILPGSREEHGRDPRIPGAQGLPRRHLPPTRRVGRGGVGMQAMRRKAAEKVDSAHITRKSLVLDREIAEEVARMRGTSISAAMRDAVDNALAAAEIVEAFQALHELG